MRNIYSFLFIIISFLLSNIVCSSYAIGTGNYQTKIVDVDLLVKSATLKSFTKAFTNQTGVEFAYNAHLSSSTLGDIVMHSNNRTVEALLDEVLSTHGFQYTIVDNTVVVSANLPQSQQTKKKVSGKIVDEAGEPLIGATVVIKGSSIGTASGVDGSYSLLATPSDILIFTFIGYTAKEEKVGTRTKIDVILKEETKTMDEVVVIGYGSQSRRTITSAVAKVEGEVLESNPINSIGDGLKGKIAGVRVATINGQPGSDPKFLIRGGSSINRSNNPIIMVDGVQREMTGLNPNDIESVEVLKDAASAGIYGSKASNGVILITTKKGAMSKGPLITFEGQWAVQDAATHFDLMNSRQYLQTIRPAILEGFCGGSDPSVILDGPESAGGGNSATSIWTTRYLEPGENVPEGYQWMVDPINENRILIFKDTDQQKKWFGDSFWQNYYIGVNGGNEVIKYAASAGYTNDGGIGIATGFSRFTLHGNTSFNITKKLVASTTFDYSQIDMQQINGGGESKRNTVQRGLSIPNTHRDWYDDDAGEELTGTPAQATNATTRSAVFYKYYYGDTGETIKRSSGTIKLEWTLFKNFKAIGQFANHNRHTRSHFFVKHNPTEGVNIRQTKQGFSETNRMNFQTYINYNPTIGQNSHLDLVMGYDYTKDKVNSFDARVQGAVSDKVPTLDVGTSNVTNYPKSTDTKEVTISYFGRLNYNYADKYLFSFTLRADGSSKFTPGNQWGYFPAGSLGWIISNENFWGKNSFINMLKARISYGLTGNNAIGLYDTYGSYSSSAMYNGNATTTPKDMPNEGLTWEKTTQFNIGLDFALFNNRINANVDYYTKVTKDLLFEVALPNITGFGSVLSNIGSVRFYGIDLILKTTNIDLGNFSWTTELVYNYNMNKVLELPNNGNVRNRISGTTIGDGSQFGGIAEKERMGRIYGYKVDHIIENLYDADAAMFDSSAKGYRRSDRKQIPGRKDIGDYEWINRNGSTQKNGKDIINEEDCFLLGYAVPHTTGGFGNTFRFKNLTLNIYLDYAIGHHINNEFQRRYFMATMGNCNYNLVNDVKKCWNKPGDNTKYARFTANDPDWGNRNFSRNSNIFIEKGDYLCVRDIALSYSLPKKWVNPIGIKDATFTISGNTLCYWTKVHGISPEAASLDDLYEGASTYNKDYNPYPPTRKYLFSAKFTL